MSRRPGMLSQADDRCSIIAAIIKDIEQITPLPTRRETMRWLLSPKSLPIWSRRRGRNISHAHPSAATLLKYDVEITDRLWSLWGGLHPRSSWFEAQSRGHQTLACCIVTCCAATVFQNLEDWMPKFLDAIIVDGDKYYRHTLQHISGSDQLLDLDDLQLKCQFQDMHFIVQPQLAAFGHLYSAPTSRVMGLYEALNFFFTRHHQGILSCQHQHLAFGYSSSRGGGYYMYDCGQWGAPLFPDNMGASYVLRTKELLLLLYCFVVTLNVRKRHVNFALYSVTTSRIGGVSLAKRRS